MKIMATRKGFCLIVLSISACDCLLNHPYKQTIAKLGSKLYALQPKRDTIEFPPLLWKHGKGTYESDVKLNFHGSPDMAAVRDDFAVYDNNMFTTAWITACLLEIEAVDPEIKPKQDQISLALEAIGQYHDKNVRYNTSVMTFWPQVLNKTSGFWESSPGNLLSLFQLSDKLPAKPLEELLKFVGLADIANVMDHLLHEKNMFAEAFHIPPDFDDTFINIGIGSLLKDMPRYYNLFQKWMSRNSNVTSVLHALEKYAYKPFSNNSRINTIDPRTYFYLHTYLEQSNKSDIALVPTWVQDTDEAMRLSDKGVAMPFFVNNVDVTVAANTIYGLTAGVLSGVLNLKDINENIQQIYLDTVDLIIFEITRNFSSRRDLALTYYPSKFECYWFVSRTFSLLQKYYGLMPLPLKIFEDTMGNLEKVMKTYITQDILKTATKSGEDTYFDDFLGDGDFSYSNKSLRKGEDRIFTTSMAMNTLLNIWTKPASNNLVYDKGITSEVNETIQRGMLWLNNNVLNTDLKPWNAFFSGSGKTEGSMPFWYPANRMEYLNGTVFHGSTFPDAVFMIGFQGVVSPEEYKDMLSQLHFGRKTPMEFSGFNPVNEPTGFFPFWSSDAYTYSTAMLALTKFINTM